MAVYEVKSLTNGRASIIRDGVDISSEISEFHLDLVAGKKPHVQLVMVPVELVVVEVDDHGRS